MQAFFFLIIIAYGIVIPHLYFYGRYIAPSIFILIFLGIRTANAFLKPKIFLIYIIGSSLFFLLYGALNVNKYACLCEAEKKLQINIGKWLYSHTQKDARIATHDIGAIVYYGRRYCIDTLGLGTKETISMFGNEEALIKFLKTEKIDFLIGFPFVYSKMVSLYPYDIRLIRIFGVENTLFSSWNFCIWETSWGESHYYKGLGFLRNNDAKSAKDEFLKAVRINKEDFLSHFMLGDILKNQGDFKNALNYYKIGLENLKKLEKEGMSVNREEIERIEAMVKSGSF
ncbi:MAG: hypothetical protein AB1397_03560 [bacterium]